MTSANLFTNLQKEDLRKRIWLFVVGLIVLLLSRPIFLLMRIGEKQRFEMVQKQELMAYVTHFCSANRISSVMVIVLLSVIIGITGYLHLYSKKKTDFYHSLPIKREKLFMVFYLNGILLYLAIYIITMIAMILVTATQGLLTGNLITVMLQTFCAEGLYFLFTYHTVILVAVITGNLLVAIIGSGIVLAYVPVLAQIMDSYFSYYFSTYFTPEYNTFPGSKLTVVSALASYTRYINQDFGITHRSESIALVITSIIMTILLLALSIWLYKKRPSEAAEKAMAFKVTELPIRILVVITMGLLGGIMCQAITSRESIAWFWFGMILVVVLSHCVMEIIYHFDFRAALSHKVQLLLTILATGIIAIFFQQDVFGYDNYIPSADKVKSVAVAFDNIDSETLGDDLDVIDGKLLRDNGMTLESYQLRHMKLSDMESVRSLVEKGVESQDSVRDKYIWQKYQGRYLHYVVKYEMKNGKEVYRSYTAKIDDVLPQVEAIYNSVEYKEGAYLLTEITNANIAIPKINIYNAANDRLLTLKEDDVKGFLETYQKELLQLTIKDLQEETPLLRLAPEVAVSNERTELGGYYIYPSNTETLEKLKAFGVDTDMIVTKPDSKYVKSILASGTIKEEYTINDKDYKEITYQNDGTKESEERIKELCDKMCNAEFCWNNNLLNPVEENITFEVILSGPQGLEDSVYMNVKKGQLPEFVKEDFSNKDVGEYTQIDEEYQNYEYSMFE